MKRQYKDKKDQTLVMQVRLKASYTSKTGSKSFVNQFIDKCQFSSLDYIY